MPESSDTKIQVTCSPVLPRFRTLPAILRIAEAEKISSQLWTSSLCHPSHSSRYTSKMVCRLLGTDRSASELHTDSSRRPQHPLAARSRRRSGQRERVRLQFLSSISAVPVNLTLLNSQGQGQPRRRTRQSNLGQTQQGCAILPTHHSGRLGGQTED